MGDLKYTDDKGTFTLDNPDLFSYLYFPLANEDGMMSAVTPDLGGDAKINQNAFLLAPQSSENLHNDKSSRNFWVYVKGKGAWSVTGRSGAQQSRIFSDEKEDVKLDAGIMWHRVSRTSKEMGLAANVTSFVPSSGGKVELSRIEVTNITDSEMDITFTTAVPLYARSADNIRDHRHVTSLLHRTWTMDDGVVICPTLTFDERGHNINKLVYGMIAMEDQDGEKILPESFCPVTEEFIGEGGNFENPYMLIKNKPLPYKSGKRVDGYESVGAARFKTRAIKPGESAVYIVALGCWQSKEEIEDTRQKYISDEKFSRELDITKKYWQEKINVSYHSADKNFDNWMRWVNFQPMLRRIYGCSFLPHHDYGKGGRGWRDLWQDCLALLIMDPGKVRGMLLDNFGGVRIDGTNATIIGNGQGEFIADRNNITRVWMDHGAWPYLTTRLYIQQTGDIEFLTNENTYFKDAQVCRGTDKDTKWDDGQGKNQLCASGAVYKGSVLEHMLLQHLTAFYDVGWHNHMRLRGADWNDALDMASKNGESVAFTALYGGNLKNMAEDIRDYQRITGNDTVSIAKEMTMLLFADKKIYDSVSEKTALLDEYTQSVKHELSGEKEKVSCDKLIDILSGMSEWIFDHIRQSEWINNKEGYCWYNGYYDDHKNAVEGDFDQGVRMMLTSQVFTVMSGVADDDQVASIVKAADKYLYDEKIGGYRLNTDFKEVKTDLGRMFGFAYGHKENGAVFSHMAVMYANALYSRGFAKEGYKVINTLYKHCSDYKKSGIYPGVPEYVNERGRGMYHYLTGAASWMLLTVLNEMYGVKGRLGDLLLEPKLLASQFCDKKASVECMFDGVSLDITYENPKMLEENEYHVKEIYIDGKKYGDCDTIAKKDLKNLGEKAEITAVLG